MVDAGKMWLVYECIRKVSFRLCTFASWNYHAKVRCATLSEAGLWFVHFACHSLSCFVLRF